VDVELCNVILKAQQWLQQVQKIFTVLPGAGRGFS
jgi:hypothetical protein